MGVSQAVLLDTKVAVVKYSATFTIPCKGMCLATHQYESYNTFNDSQKGCF